MLCEKCKKNTATVHMERVVNNTKTEYNLCAQCAAGFDTEISLDSFIKNFLSSVIGLEKSGALLGVHEDMPRCQVCGMTYEDFKTEGKLGCAECYRIFRTQLDGVLKNIHGSTEHMGKLPNKVSSHILIKREISSLKKQLREAVESEEYEAAAEIRDRIRLAESKGGEWNEI